jgi:nucleoside-diphosphate-sugar epimerase
MSASNLVSVIGGSGFIGTNVCRILEKEGVKFEILDLKRSISFPNETKIVDIRDKEKLRNAMSGGTVIHLAAVHRDDVSDKSQYYMTNVDGTQNVCDILSERETSRLIFTSTVAVYGFAPENTDEAGEINPFNDYGKSKFEAEKVLRKWHEASSDGRDLIILRPTVVFGEGNRGNVYNLIQQITSGKFVMIGAGKNRKSMAYVKNISTFISHFIEDGKGYQLYNYVDKPDFDMNDLVRSVRNKCFDSNNIGLRVPYALGMSCGYIFDVISKLTGKKFPISSIRVKKFCSTTAFKSAAHDVPGFVAPYSLGEGLEQTLERDFINPQKDQEIFLTE